MKRLLFSRLVSKVGLTRGAKHTRVCLTPLQHGKNAGGLFDTVYYQQGRRSDLHEVSLSIPTNRHSGIKIHALCSRISIKSPSIIPHSHMQCTSTQLCSASAASTLIHQCRLPSAAAQLWCIVPGHSLVIRWPDMRLRYMHACVRACVSCACMLLLWVLLILFVDIPYFVGSSNAH